MHSKVTTSLGVRCLHEEKNVRTLPRGFHGCQQNVGRINQFNNHVYLPYWSHDLYLFKREQEQICKLYVRLTVTSKEQNNMNLFLADH